MGRVQVYDVQRAVIEAKASREIQQRKNLTKRDLQKLKAGYDDEAKWL